MLATSLAAENVESKPVLDVLIGDLAVDRAAIPKQVMVHVLPGLRQHILQSKMDSPDGSDA